MFSMLNKPYPRNNDFKFRLRIVLLSGVSVSAVLYFIFSFTGGTVASGELLFNVLLFGLVTIIAVAMVYLLLPAVFTNYFKEENWTVGKNLMTWLLMFSLITVGNMLLANYLYGSSVSLKSFISFLYYTVGVGFFVYAIISLIHYKVLIKKNTAAAELMNKEIIEPCSETANRAVPSSSENGPIRIVSENGKEEIIFSVDDLLYIESADNYSKIFLRKNNSTSTSIIRSSLKRVEEQTVYPGIFRCHRAYIVNLKKVASVSGNSQGYRLHIHNMEETIPVSRAYGKELHEKLKNLSHLAY